MAYIADVNAVAIVSFFAFSYFVFLVVVVLLLVDSHFHMMNDGSSEERKLVEHLVEQRGNHSNWCVNKLNKCRNRMSAPSAVHHLYNNKFISKNSTAEVGSAKKSKEYLKTLHTSRVSIRNLNFILTEMATCNEISWT